MSLKIWLKAPPPQFVCNIYRKQVPAADDVVGVTSRVSYRHLCVHIDHLGPLQLRDGTGRDGRRYRGRPSHPTAHGRRAPTTNRKCMPVKCRDPLRTTARCRVHRPEGGRESGSRATRNWLGADQRCTTNSCNVDYIPDMNTLAAVTDVVKLYIHCHRRCSSCQWRHILGCTVYRTPYFSILTH